MIIDSDLDRSWSWPRLDASSMFLYAVKKVLWVNFKHADIQQWKHDGFWHFFGNDLPFFVY